MKKEEIFKTYENYIMSTYTRLPFIFVKGKGMKLIDIDGKVYLDFFPGWGVGSLGHCNPKVTSAVRDQVGKLIHIPNNLYHPNQAKLAKEIIYNSFDGKVFFCNSGAEANEAAIKLSRAYGSKDGRYEIISFNNSFHGRTLATIAATGQPKYKEGFAPMPEGFKSVDFNDIDKLKSALTDKTVAVMIELIQGEGGVNIASGDFVSQLRRLCDEKKMLLIVDEVQTGIGRTGKMFAYEHFGIIPDIMTLAKAIGGGLPMGVMVARQEYADILKPGMHASTFGGSPLICKAALGVFKAIQKDKLLKNTQKMGDYLLVRLNELKMRFPVIKEVRGMGLMIGVDLRKEGKPVVDECLKRGLLINCTHDTVLRLMPALNLTKKQADKALYILEKSLGVLLI